LSFLDFEEPFPRFFAHGLLIKDGAKMSKSRGNVVNPDEYVSKFGADTLRLYLMFMGPMDGSPDFRDTGIEGMKRFTDRVWRLFSKYLKVSLGGKDKEELLIKLHQTIKKVTEDIQGFRYNTAISAIMELVNLLYEKAEAKGSKTGDSKEWKEALRSLALLLAPFTPHMAEEAWVEVLGEKFSVHQASWPHFEAKYLRVSQVEMVVQINGKLRATLLVGSEEAKNEAEILKMAKSEAKVAKWIEGKKVKKSVFVPGKIINLVIG
jgi:leucyl-tRNA synthetase